MNQIKLTLFFLFSAFSWSSLDSILEVNGGKVGSKSDVESRLKDTELFFFLGLNISYVFVTLVGAMVIGGTHSLIVLYQHRCTAAIVNRIYCWLLLFCYEGRLTFLVGIGTTGGKLDSLISIPESWQLSFDMVSSSSSIFSTCSSCIEEE